MTRRAAAKPTSSIWNGADGASQSGRRGDRGAPNDRGTPNDSRWRERSEFARTPCWNGSIGTATGLSILKEQSRTQRLGDRIGPRIPRAPCYALLFRLLGGFQQRPSPFRRRQPALDIFQGVFVIREIRAISW